MEFNFKINLYPCRDAMFASLCREKFLSAVYWYFLSAETQTLHLYAGKNFYLQYIGIFSQLRRKHCISMPEKISTCNILVFSASPACLLTGRNPMIQI